MRVDAVSGLGTADAFGDASLRNSVLGIYEVTAFLPKSGGQPQYRIKRGHPAEERVVRESQLVPVFRPLPLQP